MYLDMVMNGGLTRALSQECILLSFSHTSSGSKADFTGLLKDMIKSSI